MAWNADDDARLRELHALGWSTRRIADEMGYSKTEVARHGNQLGLEWNRARTAAATQAKVVDNKARRAALTSALLDDVEKIRGKFWAPYTFVAGSKDGPAVLDLPEPDAASLRNYVTSAAVLIDKHVALAKVDQDGGRAQALSLVEAMVTGLGIATGAAEVEDDGGSLPGVQDENAGEA
jgi:hypothetical protein